MNPEIQVSVDTAGSGDNNNTNNNSSVNKQPVAPPRILKKPTLLPGQLLMKSTESSPIDTSPLLPSVIVADAETSGGIPELSQSTSPTASTFSNSKAAQRRPTVGSLIQKFDMVVSEQQQQQLSPPTSPTSHLSANGSFGQLPKPRRKSINSPNASQNDLSREVAAPVPSGPQLVVPGSGGGGGDVRNLRMSLQRVALLSPENIDTAMKSSSFSKAASPLPVRATTAPSPTSPTAQAPPIPLKEKPKILPKNLARSNATTKKRGSTTQLTMMGAAINRIPKLEFSHNHYDIYVIFKLITIIRSVIPDTPEDVKFDEMETQSLTVLLHEYIKFLKTAANDTATLNAASGTGAVAVIPSPSASLQNWKECLKEAIVQNDYMAIKNAVLLSAFEYQKEMSLVPVKLLPNYKIEACSLGAYDTYYPFKIVESEPYDIVAGILAPVIKKYAVGGDKLEARLAHLNFGGGPVLDHFDTNALAYRKYFILRDHRNYLGIHDKLGEFAISITYEPPAAVPVTEGAGGNFRMLFRCKLMHAIHHFLVPAGDVYNVGKHASEIPEKAFKNLVNLIWSKLDLSKMRKFDCYAPMSEGDDGVSMSTAARSVENYPLNMPPDGEIQKIERSLLQLDQHKTAFNYKFGLLYVTESQSNETQWFNNVLPIGTSKSFDTFCGILGETIELNGHTGFAGGLDTKNGQTGTHSLHTSIKYNIYTNFLDGSRKNGATYIFDGEPSDEVDFEIMYHVSTMLPFTEGDEQQIQRKRHIGNDLVCLVFIDKDGLASTPIPLPRKNKDSNESTSTVFSEEGSDDDLTGLMRATSTGEISTDRFSKLTIANPFDPSMIRSQFLHVYIVVQEITIDPGVLTHSAIPTLNKVSSKTSIGAGAIPAYRIYTTSLLDVPNFSPSFPDPTIFPIQTADDRKIVRNFLLAKLVNAENAAFHSTKFRTLHNRTYCGLFESIWKENAEAKDIKNKTGKDDTQHRDSIGSIMGRRSSSVRSSTLRNPRMSNSGTVNTEEQETLDAIRRERTQSIESSNGKKSLSRPASQMLANNNATTGDDTTAQFRDRVASGGGAAPPIVTPSKLLNMRKRLSSTHDMEPINGAMEGETIKSAAIDETPILSQDQQQQQ
eukprot:Partr_v1_DN28606_c1_g1_i3_m50375 putative GTPase activating protein